MPYVAARATELAIRIPTETMTDTAHVDQYVQTMILHDVHLDVLCGEIAFRTLIQARVEVYRLGGSIIWVFGGDVGLHVLERIKAIPAERTHGWGDGRLLESRRRGDSI